MVHGAPRLAARDVAEDRAKTMPSVASAPPLRQGRRGQQSEVILMRPCIGTSGYRTLAANGPAAAPGRWPSPLPLQAEHGRDAATDIRREHPCAASRASRMRRSFTISRCSSRNCVAQDPNPARAAAAAPARMPEM
jgi:hypothetical protein